MYENMGHTERHIIDDHKAKFTFSNQAFNESEDFFFATVHSLMNVKNLIDSCQAHLPVQYDLNIELILQKWHLCCDW